MFTTYVGMIGSTDLTPKSVDPTSYSDEDLNWSERWFLSPGERLTTELGRTVLLTVVESNDSAAMLVLAAPDDLLAAILVMSGRDNAADQTIRSRFQEQLNQGGWEIEHSVQRVARPCCYSIIDVRPLDSDTEMKLTMAAIDFADRLAAAFFRRVGV